jgi:imidazolonepropionase-like amidohydrolase
MEIRMADKAVFSVRRVANEDSTGWLPNHSVITEDGLISGVIPTSELPSETGLTHSVYDLGDVSLLPGLIDAHFHMEFGSHADSWRSLMTDPFEVRIMRATNHLRLNLMAGLTTLRDLGARNEVTFPIKRSLESGVIPGPRIIVAGTPITITAGHGWFIGREADSKDEVVSAVRDQVRLGAQVIKIMASGGRTTPTANPRKAQYEVETLRAAVVEAHRSNVPIVAHTLAADGIRACVEAGIDHVIHAKWYHRDASGGLDYDQAVVDRMAEQGQWADPTIGMALLKLDAEKERPDAAPAPIHWAVGVDVPLEDHLHNYRRMHESGVRFTAGLDGGDLTRSTACSWAYKELLGWSNWAAIRSATQDNAEALGISDEVGIIRPGLVADLAAFQGDPGANIRDLGVATSVVQAGKPVKLNGVSLV